MQLVPRLQAENVMDATFQPKLDRQKMMSGFDLTLIHQEGNIIFLGPLGSLITSLACYKHPRKQLSVKGKNR